MIYQSNMTVHRKLSNFQKAIPSMTWWVVVIDPAFHETHCWVGLQILVVSTHPKRIRVNLWFKIENAHVYNIYKIIKTRCQLVVSFIRDFEGELYTTSRTQWKVWICIHGVVAETGPDSSHEHSHQQLPSTEQPHPETSIWATFKI